MPADSGMAEKLSPVLREFLVPDPGIKLFKKSVAHLVLAGKSTGYVAERNLLPFVRYTFFE